MSVIEILHPDHPKVYARWRVIIGGGKSPIKWAKKPPTTRKSTAKLSHRLPEVRDSFKRNVLSSRPRVAPLALQGENLLYNVHSNGEVLLAVIWWFCENVGSIG